MHSNTSIHWQIISPKYPPSKSGIGFYTKTLAEHLAIMGDDIEIWTNRREGVSPSLVEPGFKVHFTLREWDQSQVDVMNMTFTDGGQKNCILIQFDPRYYSDNFHSKLPSFLEKRKKHGDKVWVIIHEMISIRETKLSFKNLKKYITQKKLLKSMLKHCDYAFLSSNNWLPKLKKYAANTSLSIEILPVPSNVPYVNSELKSNNLKKAFAQNATKIIGTFGTFNDPQLLNKLEKVIPEVLADNPQLAWLFLGRHSDEFVQKMKKKYKHVSQQLKTAGELNTAALSAHIQACDIMFQPYPSGVSTRRSSIMAAMLHHKAIVTTFGKLTEPIWHNSKAIEMKPWSDTASLIKSLKGLLDDKERRLFLEQSAGALYESNFSIERSVQSLKKHLG